MEIRLFLCKPMMLIRVCCMLLYLGAAPGSFSLSDPAGSASKVRSIGKQVFSRINLLRRSAGLPALSWNERLALEAEWHAANMAQRRFFSHEDPARGSLAVRLDRSNIGWSRCAENIYEETGTQKPAESAVTLWMNSPGHRKNILERAFTETGIGTGLRSDGTIIIVQDFISR